MDFPTSYEPMPIQGSKPTTLSSRENSVTHFNIFLQQEGHKCFAELEAKDVSFLLFQKFATYLLIATQLEHGDRLLAPATASSVFSGVKSTVKLRWKDHTIFQPSHESDWNALSFKLTKSMQDRNIQLGIALSKETKPIGRPELKDACMRLLRDKKSTFASVTKRFTLVTLFSVMGRAGEGALASWNYARWNPSLESLHCMWSEDKTSSQKEVNFWADADGFHMDFYNSLADYLICGGGAQYNGPTLDASANWIFPQMAAASSKSSSASRVNKIVAELIPNAPGEGENTGTSLRAGALNAIVYSGLDHIHGLIRGDWDRSKLCRGYGYVCPQVNSLSWAGRVLAGWKNYRGSCWPPRLIILNSMPSKKQQKVKNFISELFNLYQLSFKFKDGNLESLTHCCMSSLLMYFEEKCDLLGTDHVLNKIVLETASRYDFKCETLCEWGAIIRKDWVNRNEMDMINENIDFSAKIQDLSGSLLQFKSEFRDFQRSVDDMNNKVMTELSSIKSILRDMSVSSSNVSSTPPIKFFG